MSITTEHLIARAEIHDSLLRYTRGIDRLDSELVASAFHDDAMLEGYGPEPSPASAFAQFAVPHLGDAFRITQHRISNIHITVDGDTGLSEAYVLAFHINEEDGTDKQVTIFNGRYVDNHEKRDGVWKISHRTLCHDWTSVEPISAQMQGAWLDGTRDRTDPSYG